jgi:hypothetical protein
MSITIWNRIEPRTREGKKLRGKDDKTPDPLRRGLQAQIRDPLWFLTRQYQTGEFFGEDAGSPVQATLRIEAHPITGATVPADGTHATFGAQEEIPLEVRVERAPIKLGLRASVQLGLRFETMLRAANPANLAARLADFRTAYAVRPVPGIDDIPHNAADRFRVLAASRVTDGEALFVDAADTLPNVPSSLQLGGMTSAQWQSVADVTKAFVEYRRSLYSDPVGSASAWTPMELHHRFAVDVDSLGASLQALEFEGGHLDWYDFSFASSSTPPAQPSAPKPNEWTFILNPVSFRGMAKPRWWTLDERRTDFGGLDIEHTDLTRMLFAEFALLFADDWFELPVRLPIGTLSQVTLLVVTDVFGGRTLVRSTREQVSEGERPWSMFRVSGDSALAESLFLPPTLATVLDGNLMEEVDFFRDEMASMGWAVERTLQSPMDVPISGYESHLERLKANALPPAPTRQPGEPEIEYVLGTTVPDNWIPLVPISGGPRSFLFRRGLMQRPTSAEVLEDVPARGEILEPKRKPYYVAEEAVPRSGVRVSRRWRRARWIDGTTHVWLGRKVSVGRGEGASGLEFDLARPLRDS